MQAQANSEALRIAVMGRHSRCRATASSGMAVLIRPPSGNRKLPKVRQTPSISNAQMFCRRSPYSCDVFDGGAWRPSSNFPKTSNNGVPWKTRSKISIGRDNWPSASMRSFSSRCGSGRNGANPSRTAAKIRIVQGIFWKNFVNSKALSGLTIRNQAQLNGFI